MKTIINSLAAAALGASAFSTSGCDRASPPAVQAQQFTCPMHPEVVAAAPGECPKCGMKLVEKPLSPTPSPAQ